MYYYRNIIFPEIDKKNYYWNCYFFLELDIIGLVLHLFYSIDVVILQTDQ